MFSKIFPKIHAEGYKFLVISGIITIVFYSFSNFLGLIGLGKVGSQVAKIGKVFGMEVMAWSENLDLNTCKKLDVLPCSKEDLIKNSDFLSIHVHEHVSTKNLNS